MTVIKMLEIHTILIRATKREISGLDLPDYLESLAINQQATWTAEHF
jgi:hypothetical protein